MTPRAAAHQRFFQGVPDELCEKHGFTNVRAVAHGGGGVGETRRGLGADRHLLFFQAPAGPVSDAG